jgi:hypothetical protein
LSALEIDLKILFYGNCQTQVVMKALRLFNPDVEMEYAGNSHRVTKFNPERSRRLMEESDFIVSQPVMNKDNPDYVEILKEKLGEKVAFMPYIFLDGMFSISHAPNTPVLNDVVNGEVCKSEIENFGLQKALERFRRGETDFKHQERYQRNIALMRQRENFCQFKVVEKIVSYPGRAMLTHNHPVPEILIHVASQVAEALNLPFRPAACLRPALHAHLTLSMFLTVLSPYTIEDVGLKCDPDLGWFENGTTLYRKVNAAISQQA